MKNKILSYDEKVSIFKLLDCNLGYDKLMRGIGNSLFQVKDNIENFFNIYEKEMTYEDMNDFSKTKNQITMLKYSMSKIYNSESTFSDNSFLYGILYTAKLIDNNQVNSARPIFYSKQIVLDIIKYRDIIKNDFNNVFLTDKYVYDKSHIELFNKHIKNFAFLSIKIKQLDQLKNYLIYNISYLKKVNYRAVTGVKNYTDLLSNRFTTISSLSDLDPNEDNDFFGGRYDNRKKDYDGEINLNDSEFPYKIYDEW